jgi:nucleoside-diphosphate-sugar epimerase
LPPRVLVTGASGQIGAELVPYLRSRYGSDSVVAADLRPPSTDALRAGPFERLDVTDSSALAKLLSRYKIDTVYHLAGLLSAVAEEQPQLAWRVNTEGLRNVLELARASGAARVFWPSSVAVFGPDAPRSGTPQGAPLNPTTIYGVTKVAGELMCNYYHLRYGTDVRSIRYPGLISSEAPPGGGTTDYAVDMFYAALREGRYTCFLRADSTLPMMYMPDALEGAVRLMEAETVPRHLGYNLAAVSFSPADVAAEIRKHIPDFTVTYAPDFRQKIADSWPTSIDDGEARRDWGWSPSYDLAASASDMLSRLRRRLGPAEKGV